MTMRNDEDDEDDEEIIGQLERLRQEKEDLAAWSRARARAILLRLRGATHSQQASEEEVDDELREIEESLPSVHVSFTQKVHLPVVTLAVCTEVTVFLIIQLKTIATKPVRSALVVGLGLQLFQQMCGINSMFSIYCWSVSIPDS